jgi:hypothetical protein
VAQRFQAETRGMKFLALMVVIVVLVAAAATFGSTKSHAVPACASCSSFHTGPL